MPGAFTPPCSSQVPGYVSEADKFVAKGVSGIYIVAVNDAFTTQAWKEKLGATSPVVHFLADDNAAVSSPQSVAGNAERTPRTMAPRDSAADPRVQFTKGVGMHFDAAGLLGNERSQRYAAIVENGVVEQVFVEDEAPSVTVTSAENVLKAL